MSCATTIGSWSALVHRLDADATCEKWAVHEPVLLELGSIGNLAKLTESGSCAADHAMGALVRLAASDSGDELDAAMVVLHLLWPGLRFLIRRVRAIEGNAEELVAGQAMIHIRSFPWRRRTGRFAANLLMDIQSAVARELRCHPRSSEPRQADVALDSALADRHLGATSPDDDDIDIYDLFTWATRRGVVAEDEVRLLLEIEHAAEFNSKPRQMIADARGWTTRTLDRRRQRALAALRAAGPAYLAVVA